MRPHQYQQQSDGTFSITSQQESLWSDVLNYNGNTVSDGSQKDPEYPSDKNVSLYRSSSLRSMFIFHLKLISCHCLNNSYNTITYYLVANVVLDPLV